MSRGSKIRRIRMAKGISLAELSKRTGINDATLRKYENGQMKAPKPETLKRIADGLGVNWMVLEEFELTPPTAMQWLFQISRKYDSGKGKGILTGEEIKEKVSSGEIDKDTVYLTFDALEEYLQRWKSTYDSYMKKAKDAAAIDNMTQQIEALQKALADYRDFQDIQYTDFLYQTEDGETRKIDTEPLRKKNKES